MGNRAYILFQNEKTITKRAQKTRVPMVYLHWNGGPESVYAFGMAGATAGIFGHDPQYTMARFCQLVGNYFGGNTSLGVAHVTPLEAANEENGLYVMDVHGAIVARYIASYTDPAGTFRALTAEELITERNAAWAHSYNKPIDGKPSMVEQLVEIMRKACPPEEKAA